MKSPIKSNLSQHPIIILGVAPNPLGIPPAHLALLLQRQLRRQRRGLRIFGVEAAAAQEVFQLREQRHGAPSMAEGGDGWLSCYG